MTSFRAKVARRDSGSPPPQPLSTFGTCTTEQQTSLTEAAAAAKTLAERGLAAMKQEFPLGNVTAAKRANFGSPSSTQQARIIEVYQHIVDNLGDKEFDCKATCPKRGGKNVCAEGEVPGKKIRICPTFWGETCPHDYTLLHESSHNAGASGDVDTGSGYPPADAENNAYSYEYFVRDLFKRIYEPAPDRKQEGELPAFPGE